LIALDLFYFLISIHFVCRFCL